LQQPHEQEPTHWPEQQELQELMVMGDKVSGGLHGWAGRRCGPGRSDRYVRPGTRTHQGDMLMEWFRPKPECQCLMLDVLSDDLLV
jgi:hypothetical protein